MPRLLYITTIELSVRAGLLPFARYFRANGWEVDAMAKNVTVSPDCAKEFDRLWEVDWSRNPAHPRNLLSAPATVARVVQERQYDLVHVHTPVAAFVSRFALRGRPAGGPRVVYTAHGFHFHPGGHPLRNRAFEALERMAGHWTDYLVAINNTDFDSARRLSLLPDNRIRLIPGIGIDRQRFSPQSITGAQVRQVRRELQIPDGAAIFTMAAEFIPRKHHRDLLEAFRLLGAVNAVLVLPGSGRDLQKMKDLAETLGIAARVRFPGFRKDMPVLTKASLATILCSEQEGLPLAVIESLSLGVPVIGTDIRGTADLLQPGCGIKVPVGSPVHLAEAMLWMMSNPVSAAAMSALARCSSAPYDQDNILAMHRDLYAEALAS